MEDKEMLNNEELEKVSGGFDFDENTIKTDDDIHGGIIYAELQSTAGVPFLRFTYRNAQFGGS